MSDRASPFLRRRLGSHLAAAFVAAVLAAPASRLAAVDQVLVPLELAGQKGLESVRRGLERIDAGLYTDGIEAIQAVLQQDGETSGLATGGAIVRVPAELPRDIAGLRKALDDLSRSKARGKNAEGGEKQARRGGLGSARRAGSGTELRVIVDPRTGRVVRLPLRPRLRRAVRPPAEEGRRYVPVRQLAEAALCALGPEALAAYGKLYDGVAAGLLARCRDAATGQVDRWACLERVAREFFVSASGIAAAELFGDVLQENGDYRGALAWWQKALYEHPAVKPPEERLRAKILWVLRVLGETPRYLVERKRFLESPGASPSLLASIERSVPLVPRGQRPAPQPTSLWGGELTFSRLPDLPGRRLVLSWDSWLWSREGVVPLPPAPPSRLRSRYLPYFTYHFPFVPLATGASVYVSGVFSLYEMDGRKGGGAIVREYRKPFRRDLAGYTEDGASALYTTTLWRKDWENAPGFDDLPEAVLVTQYLADLVRGADYRGYDVTVEIPIRGLIAFDAGSTRILWSTPLPRGTAADDGRMPGRGERAGGARPQILQRLRSTPSEFLGSQTAALKDFSYNSAAIVKQGLVVAGGWVQRGYVSVALRALDLRTGNVVWETPIVNSGMVERTLFGEMAREPFWGAIAEEDGVIYYLSQMGAVAAVELQGGRVLWVRTYDSLPVESTLGRRPIPRDIVWGANPLLLLGHVLIATPRDSEYLYAIDAGTGPGGRRSAGRVLWKYPNMAGRGEGAPLRDLLGYHRGRLYLSGPGEIASLDLGDMDGWGLLHRGGKIVKVPSRTTLSPTTLLRVIAPGVLTAQGVVFSDHDNLRLMQLDPERLAVLSPHPLRTSSYGLVPGRVAVAGDRLVVTSRHIISAYVGDFPPEAR